MFYSPQQPSPQTDLFAKMVRDVDPRPAIGGLALYATILAAVVILEVFF